MKLTNGITLFNKQSYKVHKINKNDILEKNCNFSVPIIQNTNNTNNKTQKKKIIDRKEKEKVTLIKSFCNKNERNSRSKSNSNSKEYKKRYKSNNINNKINANIYSNNNTSYNNQINKDNNKKYIFSSYILAPLFGMRVYENAINKIFEYIKSILPKKIYIDIKKAFIKYIFEELHIKNNLLLSKTEAEIMNINLKLFYNKTTSVNRSNSKNKNQKDFSFTRNHNNNRAMNNHNYNTAKNNFSKQYIFNGLLKNHNSLYSLNKKCAKIHGVPFTFNISKSPRKSRSKSGSKEKKLINKNNNNYYSNNNIFDPDLHVFKILNQRKKNSANKNFNNTSKNKKIKKQLNSNLILSKKNKNSNITKNKISNTIIYSDKKNDIINNNNNNKSIRVRENSNKIVRKNNDINNNNISEEVILNKNEKNKQNDEQLKQIKSGLDENLKFLFNFSYENFLNKGSESESKKSISDYNNNNIEHSNQKDNNFNKDDINNNKAKENFYQPKYNN